MALSFWRGWLNRKNKPVRRKPDDGQHLRYRPIFERLEDRLAPANLLQTFTEPNGAAGDNFGYSVAAVGTDVLVGAPHANGYQGAAYLYDSSGNLLHTFTEPNGASGDSFGYSVAAVGSNVLVGAPYANGYGAAYLYDSSGNLLHTFTDILDDPNAWFGYSVAAFGSNVLVGGAQ